MSTKARYIVAADALADWKDSLFSGAAPVLYPVGAGALGRVELGPGRVVLIGEDHLKFDGPAVLVANHQSLTDILVVLHMARPFKFIAKKGLFWIPFLGWAMAGAGYIPLVRGDAESGKSVLERARDYLKGGMCVLFFPDFDGLRG